MTSERSRRGTTTREDRAPWPLVVSGTPTEHELAALVAVLAGVVGAAGAAGLAPNAGRQQAGPASRWADPGRRLVTGADGWRDSALPR